MVNKSGGSSARAEGARSSKLILQDPTYAAKHSKITNFASHVPI